MAYRLAGGDPVRYHDLLNRVSVRTLTEWLALRQLDSNLHPPGEGQNDGE